MLVNSAPKWRRLVELSATRSCLLLSVNLPVHWLGSFLGEMGRVESVEAYKDLFLATPTHLYVHTHTHTRAHTHMSCM